MSALIYCQSVLGIGHLSRMLSIASELPCDVTVVFGGEPVSGIDVPTNTRMVYQEPIRSDDTFTRYYHPFHPEKVLKDLLETRRRVFEETFATVNPDLLLFDTFPFSRRRFSAEVKPLLKELAKTRSRPVLVSSVRDLMLKREDQDVYEAKVNRILEQYFDHVLVHSPEQLDTFCPKIRFKTPMAVPHHHTGFVTRKRTFRRKSQRAERKSVVVQIGGGRVGLPLLAKIPDLSKEVSSDYKFDVFLGAYRSDLGAIDLECNEAIQVHPFGPKYYQYLSEAEALISQCGYGTMVDVFSSKIPWVTVPFGGIYEQPRRALWLQENGWARLIGCENLSGSSLGKSLEAISKEGVETKKKGNISAEDLQGAARSAEFLWDRIREKRGHRHV